MKTERAVRLMAGTLVLTGLALGFWVSSWWFALTAFVGINLVQSAFTGFCPAETILRRLGTRDGV
ncbi:MAG TPA: DUF2892 domain-containing protein [Verrucomicrobia bacterium]|nr:MAG: sulfurtransferase [Lentisphaerae bacterium GWF2_57_35]HBA82980.1 DUF2892 domain-containing protein [Verrucomicrobiota bacterium]